MTESVRDGVDLFFATPVEKLTAAIAAVSAMAPWWHEKLHEVSSVAAEWLPILGCTWLVMQMALRALDEFTKRDKDD